MKNVVQKNSQRIALAGACLSVLISADALAQGAPIAFVQPDPDLKAVPYQAFSITRGNQPVDAHAPLQACDTVHFNSAQKEIRSVQIATVFSGKKIVLDHAQPSFKLACHDEQPQKTTLTASAQMLWQALIPAGHDVQRRSAVTKGAAQSSVAATTRDGKVRKAALDLPVFSSSRSYLLPGKRALTLVWAGSAPSFEIVLRRADTGEELAKVKDVKGNRVQLPEVDLKVGQYRISVYDAPGSGQYEDQIHVVGQDSFPPYPKELESAKLPAAEKALLYVYYLEGIEDGRWTFEAMQHAAKIQPPTADVQQWFKSFMTGQNE